MISVLPSVEPPSMTKYSSPRFRFPITDLMVPSRYGAMFRDGVTTEMRMGEIAASPRLRASSGEWRKTRREISARQRRSRQARTALPGYGRPRQAADEALHRREGSQWARGGPR